METLMKKPGAWVPVMLSLGILLMELGFLLFAGPPQPEADEGVAAHLFQLWFGLEIALIALFTIKWLPQKPFPAFRILVIQIIAVLAGTFPVFYFHL